jgi:hypothetical protein
MLNEIGRQCVSHYKPYTLPITSQKVYIRATGIMIIQAALSSMIIITVGIGKKDRKLQVATVFRGQTQTYINQSSIQTV